MVLRAKYLLYLAVFLVLADYLEYSKEMLTLQNISTKRHEEVCFYSRRTYLRCLRYDQ